MNKRILTGIVVGAFDLGGMVGTTYDFYRWQDTGIFPGPDIISALWAEMWKWLIIGAISLGFFLWGWFCK